MTSDSDSVSFQTLTLLYGSQVRHIKSLMCQAELANKCVPGSFSPEDLITLKMVHDVALERARRTYEEARRKLSTTTTETNCGIAQESRTYNGK